jgi:type IV secretion system protein VirB8
MDAFAREDAAYPVPPGELGRNYREAVSFQGDRARRFRNRARIATTLAAGSFALNLMLGYGILSMLPLVRVVPVFAWPGADGSTETRVMFSSLPKDKRVAGIEASLWQYVRQREEYSANERPYDYDVVSAMSAPAVRDAYQNWANSKDPSNPAVKLGRKGYINVSRVDAAFVQHNEDYSSGTYRVVFNRKITEESVKDPIIQRMIVSVTYVIADSIPVWQRVNFNPDGVIVTEYPEATQDGAPHRAGEAR